jgi:hypothetical protein
MKILLKKPFILFEIENFLDDQTYESLDKTFPAFNFKDLNNMMENFHLIIILINLKKLMK